MNENPNSEPDGRFELVRQAESETIRRKGEIPDHSSAHSEAMLIYFRKEQEYIQSLEKVPRLYVTSRAVIPLAYPPSTRALADLKPITIKDMQIGIHHRGRSVTLFPLTAPARAYPVLTIAGDENRTTVLLELHHQLDASIVPVDDLLPFGSACIVKEPYFKVSEGQIYSIRVDHVSDLIWVTGRRNAGEEEFVALPSEDLLNSSSQRLREEGNKAVANKRWITAESWYSDAVAAAQTPEEKRMAYLNRSLANVRLGNLHHALRDAIEGRVHTTQDASAVEKSLFREAKALYALKRYEDSGSQLEQLLATFPNNTDARSELQRARMRIHEQNTGEYDFSRMNKQAEGPCATIDSATFRLPLVIRATLNRGRGLFLTRDVKAGELLLCEKAFGYVYADSEDPLTMKNVFTSLRLETGERAADAQPPLVSQVVQKLAQCHPGSKMFSDLHRGDYGPMPRKRVDGQPVIDSFFVTNVVRLNNMTSPRTSREEICRLFKGQPRSRDLTRGVWLLASYINHSCVANCSRSFIGDMLILRANQDLKKDTELLFQYTSPGLWSTHEDVKKLFGGWDFECSCSWCADIKSTSDKVFKKRRALHGMYTRMAAQSPLPVARLKQLCSQIFDTYDKVNKGSQIRIVARKVWRDLGSILYRSHQYRDAVDALAKALESQGFEVTVCLPAHLPASESTFEIKTWGMAMFAEITIFAQLSEAFSHIAPHLVKVVDGYARIAYRINVGEDLTFAEAHEEFKRL